MQLPLTAAQLYFHLDPSRKFFAFNQAGYPALQVASALNRANELPITQPYAPAQPLWAQNAIQGLYAGRNNSGSLISGTVPGHNGFIFNGAQYLECDTFASQFNGTETPITVCAVVQSSNFASGSTQTVWALANSSPGNTNKLSCSYSSSTIVFAETSSAGTKSVSIAIDNGVHVITCSRTPSGIFLKTDGGQQTASTGLTNVSSAYTTFCVGAVNSNASVGSYYNGAIGRVLVFGGLAGNAADTEAVEIDLMAKAGVARPNDITYTNP